MIDVYKSALLGQFHAALAMLESAVRQCPDEHWHGIVGTQPFSHVAYHTLFYTDFYLTQNEASYRRPPFHREEYQFFGGTKLPSEEEPIADFPFPREVVLEYVDYCHRKANEVIAAETAESLAGPPGFEWYKIPRAEFLLNEVRHIQHHTAQLGLYLRRVAGLEFRWVQTG
jgi:hypothetical protein